jgi:hypothetical protein
MGCNYSTPDQLYLNAKANGHSPDEHVRMFLTTDHVNFHNLPLINKHFRHIYACGYESYIDSRNNHVWRNIKITFGEFPRNEEYLDSIMARFDSKYPDNKINNLYYWRGQCLIFKNKRFCSEFGAIVTQVDAEYEKKTESRDDIHTPAPRQ